MMTGVTELGGIFASSTSLALISIAVALAFMWVWNQQKPRKDFPPGPAGWPLIGNILEINSGKAPHIILLEYAKKYGDIFSYKIGQRWTVVLNGSAVIKDALLTKGVEFANRPDCFTFDAFSEGGKDIAFSQFTPTWKLHRKLAYAAFRTLATGNNERFEKLVYSILPGLTKHLNSMSHEPFNPKEALSLSVCNIMSTMCFGKQFEFDEPQGKFWMRMIECTDQIFTNGAAGDYFPLLMYFHTPAVAIMETYRNEFLGAINKELEEHHARYDGGEPNDLIEMLFLARQELENEGSEDLKKITEVHIRQTVADVFTGGTGTSIETLHWCVGLLVQHPEIQAKVATEVDEVVGRDRNPCLNDRDNLPYTTATLYEVMRYSSLAPLSLPRATTKEVHIGGYTIPEGTWVFVNLYSMHFDEKLWDEPRKFQPEHFLDKTGEVRTHPEGFMPFSTGRRVCLGESLAKAELFLLFSWLFQHFKFAKAPGMGEKNYAEADSFILGNYLKKNDVIVEKRF